MSLLTQYYNLKYFTSNEIYSASADKSRFHIIDNHFAALSDFFGDGVITGWDIVDVSSSAEHIVSVSPGMGLISRHVSRSFGDLTYTIQNNSSVYLYMQRKIDFLGGFSIFSDISHLVYIDTTPPPVPSYVEAVGWDFSYVSILWDNDPSETPDFDKYAIYRSTDDFATETFLAYSVLNSYTDSTVLDNVEYKYRITSLDTTGNESSPSPSTIAILTLKDVTPPLDPKYAMIFPGDSFIELVWKAPDVGDVDRYEIWIQELDKEYQAIGAVDIFSISDDKYSYKITELSNSIFYEITLYTVNANGIYSSGSVFTDAPRSNLGPEEVASIDLSLSQSEKNQYGIALTIDWVAGVDPYNEIVADKYVITIIENGRYVSEEIYVYDETSLTIELFYCEGRYHSILPRTDYIIKIEAQDSEGHISNSLIQRIYTVDFAPPAPPTMMSYNQKDNGDIFISWMNSTSFFEYNLITIVRKNLLTLAEIYIENQTNYAKNVMYFLSIDDLVLGSEYTITLQSVDEFGKKSQEVSLSFSTPTSDNNAVAAPVNVSAHKGNGYVSISWDKVETVIPEYYKIWRSPYSERGFLSDDFSLVSTISADYNDYDDYSIETGGRYVYFVTTVDIYGRESFNPVDHGFFQYSMAFAYYSGDSSFNRPQNVMATKSGYDVIVSWDVDEEEFDGYEIWRSIGDLNSWEKAGHADKTLGTWIDDSILSVGLSGGTDYYYMVRKFRNEVTLVATGTPVAPVSSILVGKASVVSGRMVIDSTLVDSIQSFSDVVYKMINENLAEHKHVSRATYDSRIDLGRNVTVKLWTTSDYQTFTTTETIAGAETYYITVDSKVPTISYSIIPQEKKIVFESPITASNIYLECVGLSEIADNGSSSDIIDWSSLAYPDWDTFSSEEWVILNFAQQINTDIYKLEDTKIDEVSATQANSGYARVSQLGEISHDGRLKEELIPLQLPMISDDAFIFDIHQNTLGDTAVIGTALSFYDVLEVDLELETEKYTNFTDRETPLLIVSTSKGISYGQDGDWGDFFETDSAPHKLYSFDSNVTPQTDFLNGFFALTATNVYISKDGISWAASNGLQNISSVRDIVADGNGNIYVTTNIGIYKLSSESNASDYFLWESIPAVSSATSNIFAITYDDYNSKLLVSTDNGLYSSVDEGLTWSVFSELLNGCIVKEFIMHGEYLFALTDTSVWRKHYTDSLFEQIASLSCEKTRRLRIFDSRLLVSSDIGLLRSDDTYNVYSDTDIEFSVGLSRVKTGGKELIITCIGSLSSLILGCDSRLFLGSSYSNITSIYSESLTTTPSVFVDNELCSIGNTWDSITNRVYFSEMVSHDSEVTVANQYKVFKAKHGGWLAQNYLSSIDVYKNGSKITQGSYEGLSGISSLWGQVEFDTMTEGDYHLTGATAALTAFSSYATMPNYIEQMQLDGSNPSEFVANVDLLYRKVYSNLVGKVRYATQVDVTERTNFEGDFNNDLLVNGTDYLIWQAGYPTSSGATKADGDSDGDGDVDGGDFLNWQSSYNSAGGSIKSIMYCGFLMVPYDLYTTILSDYEIVPDIGPFNTSYVESNLSINIVNGIFTFDDAFDKNDNVVVDVYSPTFLEQQSFVHSQIDDAISSIDSGLPYQFASVQQCNLLKTGLFIENEWAGQQTQVDNCNLSTLDTYNAGYYTITNNSSWYDSFNSTVDYEEQVSYEGEFFNYSYPSSVLYISESNKVLVGYSGGMLEIDVDTVEVSRVNLTGLRGVELVRDIKLIDGTVYVISDEHIYVSFDSAVSWSVLTDVAELAGKYLFIAKINKYFVIATDNGLYYKDLISKKWIKSLAITGITYLENTDTYGACIVNGNILYYSTQGSSWQSAGLIYPDNIRINAMKPYTNTNGQEFFLLATNMGIRWDAMTFNSDSPGASLYNVSGDYSGDLALECNDIALNDDGNGFAMVASDGSYYSADGIGGYVLGESDLNSIHKAVSVDGDYWLFGFDMLRIGSSTAPIKIVSGVPF